MNTRVEGAMRLAQVAVPVPQLNALSYSIPDEFPEPVPGARVLVPLGKRVLTGVVLSVVRDARSGIRDDLSPNDASRADPAPRIPDPGPLHSDPAPRIPDTGSVKPIIDILDH